jgi:hypothetical protein
MSEASALTALEAIDRAQEQRRVLDAAEAAAWVEFAVGYDSLGGRRVCYAGDGTPAVDEFVALELAAALRRREASVRVQLVELLDLAYRLPRLWELVGRAALPVWLGRLVARHTRPLPAALAGWVDATLAPFAERLGSGRLEAFCVALVAQADPVRAAAARERARNWRGVELVPSVDPAMGVRELHGLIDTADAFLLDAALEQLAGILARTGATDPHSQLRATALGILATPARALVMIQQDLTQPALVEPHAGATAHSGSELPVAEPADQGGPFGRAGTGRGPAGCAGTACGTITVDPDRLLPKATLVVHLSDAAIGDPHGICRVEGVGPVPVGRCCCGTRSSCSRTRRPPMRAAIWTTPIRGVPLVRRVRPGRTTWGRSGGVRTARRRMRAGVCGRRRRACSYGRPRWAGPTRSPRTGSPTPGHHRTAGVAPGPARHRAPRTCPAILRRCCCLICQQPDPNVLTGERPGRPAGPSPCPDTAWSWQGEVVKRCADSGRRRRPHPRNR